MKHMLFLIVHSDPDFSVTFTNDTPMVSGLNVTLDLLTRGMECPTEFVCDVEGVGPVDCEFKVR